MVDIERIRSLAREKNLSLTELEQVAGISNGTIGKWKESSPKIDTLLKICLVLECEIDQIVKRE